ncbi:MAG: DUF5110 domain-containing protein [Phycisphaerales bacterium]|nr:DUF5110 domain-containing protein [Phycisphaerales bacterium]
MPRACERPRPQFRIQAGSHHLRICFAAALLFPALAAARPVDESNAASAASPDPVADPAAVVIRGNARITVLSDAVMRLEYSPTGVFEDRPSATFRNRRMPVPWFQVVSRDGFMHVRASDLLIRLREPDGRFTRMDLTARVVSDGAGFWWTPDVRDERSLGGPLSRSGWALIDDSATPLLAADGEAAVPQRVPGALDWYLFSHGDAHARALRDFTALTGRPPLPPFEAMRSILPPAIDAPGDRNLRLVSPQATLSIGGGWSDLPAEIAAIAQSGNHAAPLVGVVLGDRVAPDDALLRRQAQAAALAPLLSPNPAFANFPEVEALRRELAPTIYSAARRAHDEGLPIWRPMYIRWRYLDEAYARPAQFMLGDDLLVAPVCDPAQSAGGWSASRVWLAEGGWINRRTGERCTGPMEVLRLAAPDELPIWMRAGAIVAAHSPDRDPSAHESLRNDNAGESNRSGSAGARGQDGGAAARLVLHVVDGESGETRIYEDDGRSLDYQAGRYSWTRVTQETAGARRVVTIHPAEGEFQGASATRDVELRLHGSPPLRGVTVNGVELRRRRSPDAIGWWFDPDALCPVIRFSAPDRRALVTIEARAVELAEWERSQQGGLRGRLAHIEEAAREIGAAAPTTQRAAALRGLLAAYDPPAARSLASDTGPGDSLSPGAPASNAAANPSVNTTTVPLANSVANTADGPSEELHAALLASQSPEVLREILRSSLPERRRTELIMRLLSAGFSAWRIPTDQAAGAATEGSASGERVSVLFFHRPLGLDPPPLQFEVRARVRAPDDSHDEPGGWVDLKPISAPDGSDTNGIATAELPISGPAGSSASSMTMVECEITFVENLTRLTATELVRLSPPKSPPRLQGPPAPSRP